MKLNASSARDAGASSTRRNSTASSVFKCSITFAVNSPSPDHFVVSTSTAGIYRDVNRHQSPEERHGPHVLESVLSEQGGHTFRSRVIANRFGDVSICIGIAVQHEPQRGSHNGEIR